MSTVLWDGENTYEEGILRDLSDQIREEEESRSAFSFADYIASSINLDVPKEAVLKILIDRDVEVDAEIGDVEPITRKLCIADLYVWACMGNSRKGSMTDVDNGWTHSNGGYSLTADDKRLLLNKANVIYEANGEPTVGKTKVTVQSRGIKKSDIFPDGTRRPRFNRYV